MTDATGPMGCPPDRRDSLIEMVDEVFRKGMLPAFPHLFAPDNIENCRVTVADDKVVSHIGYTVNDAVIMKCPVKVACLGGVGTLEKYRGRGYASAQMTDCLDRMRTQGVHLLMVSGGRSMYKRNHCMHVGVDWKCGIDGDAARRMAAEGIEVVAVDESNLEEVIALQERDPVRFDRTRGFWSMALGWCRDSWRKANVLGMREAGVEAISAYVIIGDANDEGYCRMSEWGGSRRVALGGIDAVYDHLGAKFTEFHVAGWDAEALELLADAGVEVEPTGASGTQRVIDFVGLFEALRPLFAASIGEDVASTLKFSEADERFTVALGDSALVIPDRDTLVKLVFGTHDGAGRELLQGSPAADAMGRCLPVPALNYGISYV